jgi:hypothetical protein
MGRDAGVFEVGGCVPGPGRGGPRWPGRPPWLAAGPGSPPDPAPRRGDGPCMAGGWYGKEVRRAGRLSGNRKRCRRGGGGWPQHGPNLRGGVAHPLRGGKGEIVRRAAARVAAALRPKLIQLVAQAVRRRPQRLRRGCGTAPSCDGVPRAGRGSICAAAADDARGDCDAYADAAV